MEVASVSDRLHDGACVRSYVLCVPCWFSNGMGNLMDWQQITSLLIVALTVVLLVRHEVAKRQRAKLRAGGNDCGCRSDTLERIRRESSPAVSRKNVRRAIT